VRFEETRVKPSPVWLAARTLALGAYLIFALFPLYWIIKIAVTPNKALYSEALRAWPSSVTFENFASVFAATPFPTYFANSVIVSLSTAFFATILASLCAAAFSRYEFRFKSGIAFVLLLTQFFPLVIVLVPLFRLLVNLGLVNNLWGLIVVYTAINTPFAVFLMKSFFDGIPRELDEAALIDGCTRFGALWRVVLPLTLPGVAATLGFVFTGAWSELLFALMLINSESQKTFAVGLLDFVGKGAVNWGQMMAASTLALIPVVIFFGFIQRYLIRGLTAGAVKG
jgi:multiple sugar transport system permease protein